MENETDYRPAEDRMNELKAQRRKRRARRRWSAVMTVLAIVLLTGAVILILNDGASMLKGLLNDAPTASENKTTQEANSGAEKYTTVTIAAVGDIGISDALLADARSADGYDFSPSFFGAASLLSDADLTVGNLECTLNGGSYGTAAANAPTMLADTLAGLGFDLLQTANSASIMGGMAGLTATLDNLERSGIDPVGTFRSAEERSASGGVTIREVNGIRVAFIAFTKGLGNMSLPENSEYAVNLLYSDYDTNYRNLDTDAISAAMEQAKKKDPDIIIALVHWGSEFSRDVSSSQKRVANLLYENGADAIIGTHSRMVGPIETQTITLENGTSKDVVTAYDLGDFYTDSTRAGTQLSLVLRLEFTHNNWTDQTTLTDLSYTPVYCADFGASARDRYQVLNVANALELYRQEYVFRVDDETYECLLDEMEALPNHVHPPEADEEE